MALSLSTRVLLSSDQAAVNPVSVEDFDHAVIVHSNQCVRYFESFRLSDVLRVGFVPRLNFPNKFGGVFQSLLTLSPALEICWRLVQQPEKCFGLSEAFSIKLHRHQRQCRRVRTFPGCATASTNLIQHLL